MSDPGGPVPDETYERNVRFRFEQWASNPACDANTVSAVLGTRMREVAKAEGGTGTFGQSPFALARGRTFERTIFRDNAARLLQQLSGHSIVPPHSAGFRDLRSNAFETARAQSDAFLKSVHRTKGDPPAIWAGLAIRIPGDPILPETNLIIDLIAARREGDRVHLRVAEVKTYPHRGGYTDPLQLAGARAQCGIYIYALREHLSAHGLADRIVVDDDGFLVLTEAGTSFMSIHGAEDLAPQIDRAARGLARLRTIGRTLPTDPRDGIERVRTAAVDYTDACVGFCDRAATCHDAAWAAERPAILGDDASRAFRDLPLSRVCDLLEGRVAPGTPFEQDLVDRGYTVDLRRRLDAWRCGCPVPSSGLRGFRIGAPDEILRLALVRMGGESSPWAIGWAIGEGGPQVHSVADPRKRALLPAMLEPLAEALIDHLRPREGWRPQIWVPNGTHLEMIHLLGYALRPKQNIERAPSPTLVRLGKLANALFRESTHPGQQLAMDASRVLREFYSFPAQPTRAAHLGFLLAWLTSAGDRESRRRAAATAEQQPVGWSLDPDLERKPLDALVQRFDKHSAPDGDTDIRSDAASRIATVLHGEISRRLDLVKRAIVVLRADARHESPGVPVLTAASEKRVQWIFEKATASTVDAESIARLPSPSGSSSPLSAARELAELSYAVSLQHDALAPFDEVLQDGLISAGDGFVGTVERIGTELTKPNSRTTRALWTMRMPQGGDLRLKVGDAVFVGTGTGWKATIAAIDQDANGDRQIDLAFESYGAAGRTTTAQVTNATLRGSQHRVVKQAGSGMVQRHLVELSKLSNGQVPGDWAITGPIRGTRHA
jgi:hypothetical protein